MNCPRCNYTFTGSVCPLCFTKIEEGNKDGVKVCSNCDHHFIGIYCPSCGTKYAKPEEPVMYTTNGGKCLRCGAPTTTGTCDHCGYKRPVTVGYMRYQTEDIKPLIDKPRPRREADPQNAYNTNPYNKNNYGYPPYYTNTKPKKDMLIPIVMIAFSVILVCSTLALILIGFIDFGGKQTSTNSSVVGITPPSVGTSGTVDYPQGISFDEYKKIKLDMEYAQVSAIIGGDGKLMNNEKTDNDKNKAVYAWYGESVENAMVFITFEDAKVVKIEQEGLF